MFCQGHNAPSALPRGPLGKALAGVRISGGSGITCYILPACRNANNCVNSNHKRVNPAIKNHWNSAHFTHLAYCYY